MKRWINKVRGKKKKRLEEVQFKFGIFSLIVMPKAWPLYPGAESNLADRILGEVEKKSFIALPGKGGHSRLIPLKAVCPNLGGFGVEFYSNGSRARLLIRIRVCAGLVLL